MTFEQLQIIEPILRALIKEGYVEPTDIQVQAIPILMEGRDILGSAQTGTGKTAAFAIPTLQRLYTNKLSGPHHVRALILAPTRELAAQIGDSFKTYGANLGIRSTVVFGGVSKAPQIHNLKSRCDILIATPGRLLDLVEMGVVDIGQIEVFILDEADQMLDMGFLRDIKRVIAKLPHKRQTMMFSATMPEEIEALAKTLLNNPVRIAVTPVEQPLETIEQSLYFVDKRLKVELLLDLLNDKNIKSLLVFTRTKHGANKLAQKLQEGGHGVGVIHGNKSQPARIQALNNFKNKKLRILVATDIAARGIDIDQLSHVLNYELPEVPETYLHRMGRTGRAGFSGTVISFCAEEEIGLLSDIQWYIGMKIPVNNNYPALASFKLPISENKQGHSPKSNEKKPQQPSSAPRMNLPSSWSRRSGGRRRRR
ncbi:MAG TPA: DEAD/DEAH box helicase [Bacilli bacterium]|nr:DEAD/DEAH box helicase [Bacilli bacterium]